MHSETLLVTSFAALASKIYYCKMIQASKFYFVIKLNTISEITTFFKQRVSIIL